MWRKTFPGLVACWLVTCALMFVPTVAAAQTDPAAPVAGEPAPAPAPNPDPAPAPAPPAPAPTPPAPPAPAPDPLAVPAESGQGRRVVYSVGAQRVWLVEADGSVARTYLVSGHIDGVLPGRGRYRVYSKSLKAVNQDSTATMTHMVRFARGDNLPIGFHSIPLNRRGRPIQSLAQLGRPLSAGCIRQAPADAEFLYNWAPVGTTVNVVK